MSGWADPARYAGTLAIMVSPHAARGVMFAPAHGALAADVTAMAIHARGICTVTVNEGAALRLGLHVQGQGPRPGDEPYLVNSVEAVACSETGISASERATTMRAIGNPDAAAADLISPGHVMVQVARNILRDGSTAPELANALLSAHALARFAAWTDILDDDGELGSVDWCLGLAARLGLPCFDGDAVRRFARARLPAWEEVVRFSDAHFGRSPQIG